MNHKIDPPVSQPPFITWSVLAIYNMGEDKEFLEEVYDPLVKFHNWWYEYRDRDGDGLVEYMHVWETGWDSSPRWDLYPDGIGRNPQASSHTHRYRSNRSELHPIQRLFVSGKNQRNHRKRR